jgi:hypothetical protein
MPYHATLAPPCRRRYSSCMPEEQSFNEPTLKHLEFIQAVIARQANNSFLIKGWGLTVAGAFYAFAANRLNWRIALVGLLPALTFWGLDAYFLRQERLFRCLYDAVRKAEIPVDLFCMNPRDHPHNVKSWRSVLVSRTLLWFHGMVVAVGLVLVVAGLRR